jgi:hypothetical protein
MKMDSKTKSSRPMPPVRGGSTSMAGKSGAAPAVPGQVSLGGRSGNTRFAPDTASNGMAGYSGSKPAKGC